MPPTTPGQLTCHWCGQVHHVVPLRRGERALCAQCGNTLTHRPMGRHAGLALTLTAAILTVPATELPLVTVQKFGSEHVSYLWTGVRALWQNGMPVLSVWVALCGIIVPIALITALIVLLVSPRAQTDPASHRFWIGVANAVQRWSMPEVYVLAVLVAFVKIGALVQVDPGAGLWFYGAMSVTTMFAWRSADVEVSL
jgi:paraquat-inducible protein A